VSSRGHFFESGDTVQPHELAAVSMLARLPVGALWDLADHAHRRAYAPGEVVFAEGDAGEAFQIVRRGVLKVVRPSLDPDQVLELLTAGSVFGELAVLNRTTRLASVIAVGECETIEVGKEAFDRALDVHPEAVRSMLGDLARSLTLAKEEVSRQKCLLEDAVRERTHEVRETQLEVIRRLGRAAESRDYETGLHVNRMSRLASAIARGIGMSEEESRMLLYAAPLHDIGKIGIPDRILLKAGKLDADEWAVMKTHTTEGAKLLAGSRSEVVQMAEIIALTHHEKWDGSGYPLGLAGEQIPLVSRVCAACDVFDALISTRPYKAAWPIESALAEIERESGRHFDPRIADRALELIPDLYERSDGSGPAHAADLPPQAPAPTPPYDAVRLARSA
jgi:HD-GYP domain-containing protein (c-di-GMP phosphodiesterase class II)